MADGKVVGGQYMNATVILTAKGDLALQVPLKFKKVPVSPDTVAEWEELAQEARGGATGAISTVGQAVAGAVLPGIVGRMASAAIGSTINSTTRPPHTLRIDWTDGKQSLIQLPEKLFTHFAVLLKDRQALPAPYSVAPATVTSRSAGEPDVVEQIAKLASLRDQGVLTEDEFATKKSELLARL